MAAYPQYTPSVMAKLQSLSNAINDSDIIWGHYIGQTMSDAGPIGRHEADCEHAFRKSGMMTTFYRWITFTSSPQDNLPALDWKIYEFRSFHTPLDLNNSLGSDGDIWRSRSDLQELEAGLVLAADRRGWNSAPGGFPQTRYTVPSGLKDILSSPSVKAQVSSELLQTTFVPPDPDLRRHFQVRRAANLFTNNLADPSRDEFIAGELLDGSCRAQPCFQSDGCFWLYRYIRSRTECAPYSKSLTKCSACAYTVPTSKMEQRDCYLWGVGLLEGMARVTVIGTYRLFLISLVSLFASLSIRQSIILSALRTK
jgi:hypothetical protein